MSDEIAGVDGEVEAGVSSVRQDRNRLERGGDKSQWRITTLRTH